MSKETEVNYLLIGSGVAAATIAKRLLEKDPDQSILMLEAGDRIPARDRGLWWDYVTRRNLPYDYTYDTDNPQGDTGGDGQSSVGNVEWTMRKSRVTAMGGTTMHWGGWSLRMKPEDFQLKSNTKTKSHPGNGGDWLFGYDELLPYYHQAETFLSVGGDDPAIGETLPQPAYPYQKADLPLKAAFEASGMQPGLMPLARYRRCMTTGTCRYCPVGARFNAQYVNEELEDKSRFPNFSLRVGVTVTRVLVDEGKSRVARGVEYQDRYDFNQTHRVYAKTVIICAGAFESPKLLMRSICDAHPDGIGNAFDQLGRYLVSHSFLSVSGTARSNPEKVETEFGFPTLMSRHYDSPDYQKRGKIFLFRNQSTPGLYWNSLMQKGMSRGEIDAVARGPMSLGLSAFYEEFGRPENRLTINGTRTDRFGLPLAIISFSRSPKVIEDAHSRLAIMENIYAKVEGFAMNPAASKLEGAAGYHASGTCRMSSSPEDGVVDENLRVHDMDNLFVCSNAVFPSIGAVNPTLTLTAVAFRLADYLNGDMPAKTRSRAEVSV